VNEFHLAQVRANLRPYVGRQRARALTALGLAKEPARRRERERERRDEIRKLATYNYHTSLVNSWRAAATFGRMLRMDITGEGRAAPRSVNALCQSR
jgi:phytoene dehydrogenase-like protein